jgi:hypothetical protein
MANIELVDVLNDNFVPRKSAIHDCHDTGVAKTLTTTLEKYTNDAAVRNWNTVALWDTTTNYVDCSTLPVGSKLDIILSSDIAAGNQGALVLVEYRCPNGGAPFLLAQTTTAISKNDAYPERFAFTGYVGPEVQQYGIEIYSGLQSGSLDVSNRKLLVRA